MSRQLRIRLVGLLVALLFGLATVGVVVPACGFQSPNLQDTPSDAMLLFDAPPDVFIPDAAPCSSLIKTCVSGTVLRACQSVGQLPAETNCDWGCSDVPEAHCMVLTPSGGAVTSADLDRTMAMADGLQKRSFTTLTQPGSINTDTGAIQIGFDIRQAGTGVRNGVDFKVVNGVGVFRFMELELKGFMNIRVTGTNALALVAIDKISIREAAALDMRGTCTGTTAGPGGKSGGGANTAGSGTGAGGGGDNTGVCSGGGGAGNSAGGANGGGRANAGGVAGNANISVLTGGAGGGGGGTGGDGGGGGGAIQLVSNGSITLSTAGINAGGCGGKAGPCGGGAGAGGAILIEGKTVDFGGSYLAANGGGGGGAANGTSGEMAQVSARANGGAGATPMGPNNDGGDGGSGGDDGATASPGGVRDMRGGGGGGGVGWIRINTKTGSIGTSNTLFSPPASNGMANVQ